MKSFKLFLLPSSVFLLASCSSVLKYENSEKLKTNKEFETAVKIEKPPVVEETPENESGTTTEVTPAATSAPVAVKDSSSKKAETKKNATKAETAKSSAKVVAKTSEKPQLKSPETVSTVKTASDKSKATAADKTKSATVTGGNSSTNKVAETVAVRRQPEIEDSVGFNGRRPIVDPFQVGEVVVHDVNYFKVSAGELRMKVEPFATVNGRKSYSFAVEIKSKSLFDTFYSVDDRAETFVDYDDLIPRAFQLHVKESGQLREAKMAFDVNKGTATFWEKKVTKKDGEEEKKFTWDILPYSQNVYSAIFYLRNFTWEVGKEHAFRVANDKDNMIFSGKAIRKEVLKTKAGTFNTIVVKPNITLKGKFKPIGDNYVWITDDDRKYIVRIESKIKIGTLVSEVVEIKAGKAN